MSDLPDPNEEFLRRSHAEIMRARRQQLEARSDYLDFVPAQLAGYRCPTCGGSVGRIKGAPETREPGVPGEHDHWLHCRECDVYWDDTHPHSASWRVLGPHPWL